jgi:hypothetical protein
MEEEINGMSKERYMACEILEVFEDFLARKGIEIPNKERDEYYEDNPEDKEEKAILFGGEYYSLEDEVTELLERFKIQKN